MTHDLRTLWYEPASNERSADLDGNVFITYFDRDAQLSFCWNPAPDEHGYVEVSYGSSGEPLVAAFDIDQTGLRYASESAELVACFKQICDTWIEHYWNERN